MLPDRGQASACPHAAARSCLALACLVRTWGESPGHNPESLARDCAQLEAAYGAARFGDGRLSRMSGDAPYRLAGRDYRTAHQAVVDYARRVLDAIRAGAGDVYGDFPTPVDGGLAARPEARPPHELVTGGDVWEAARPHLTAVGDVVDVPSVNAHLAVEWDRLARAGEVAGAPPTVVPIPVGKATPRLTVDLDRQQVTLDGKTHDVGSLQALRWLNVLAAQPGRWVTSRELENADPDLQNARTDRLKKQLPRAVSELLDSNAGRGSRIRL